MHQQQKDDAELTTHLVWSRQQAPHAIFDSLPILLTQQERKLRRQVRVVWLWFMAKEEQE